MSKPPEPSPRSTAAVLTTTSSPTAQVGVMLLMIWWMYAGYAWLTNVIDLGDTAHRAFLLVAMAAYLILALAVPRAFSGSGFAFGVAYLLIIVVHASLFSHAMSLST